MAEQLKSLYSLHRLWKGGIDHFSVKEHSLIIFLAAASFVSAFLNVILRKSSGEKPTFARSFRPPGMGEKTRRSYL
jgi:hypothetical protein